MKQETAHHEILLFTGNSSSQRQFCSIEENNKDKKLSPVEELEKACWAGILFEMFPEILGRSYSKREMFIWEIMNGKNFLRISIGPTPTITENETTIDPYFCMLNISEK